MNGWEGQNQSGEGRCGWKIKKKHNENNENKTHCRKVFPFARFQKSKHKYTVLRSFSGLETFANT